MTTAAKWSQFARETMAHEWPDLAIGDDHFTAFGNAMMKVAKFDKRAGEYFTGDSFDRMWVRCWFLMHMDDPKVRIKGREPEIDEYIQRASCFIAAQTVFATLFAAWVNGDHSGDWLRNLKYTRIKKGHDGLFIPVEMAE